MVGLNPAYTYTKDSVYYYGRSVPKDIRGHYIKGKIVICLRTKSSHKASIASTSISAKLEAYWLTLRISSMDIPAAHLLAKSDNNSSNTPTVTTSKDLYLRLKGMDRSKTFYTSAERNTRYLIECLGDRPINEYTSSDAGLFRDWMLDKSLSSSSIRRILTTVKAIISLAITEHGLEFKNPFSSVYIHDTSTDATKRHPISTPHLIDVQTQCKVEDDDIRWLIGLISDTGMRLSEAVGLVVEDFHLNGEAPYVRVQPHFWRSLKTLSSTRSVPLVGASLWAATQIVTNAQTSFCFDRYCNRSACNANAASATLNKWIKQIGGPSCTVHGFRHSLRDRLRNADAPSELIDQIGGWSLQTIGQGYGDGYSIEKLHEWMKRIEL